jgi:hypothetical protein
MEGTPASAYPRTYKSPKRLEGGLVATWHGRKAAFYGEAARLARRGRRRLSAPLFPTLSVRLPVRASYHLA